MTCHVLLCEKEHGPILGWEQISILKTPPGCRVRGESAAVGTIVSVPDCTLTSHKERLQWTPLPRHLRENGAPRGYKTPQDTPPQGEQELTCQCCRSSASHAFSLSHYLKVETELQFHNTGRGKGWFTVVRMGNNAIVNK